MFKKKYKKYNKILNRLMWLNAYSSGISVATGRSSVARFATFIGLHASIPLGAVTHFVKPLTLFYWRVRTTFQIEMLVLKSG